MINGIRGMVGLRLREMTRIGLGKDFEMPFVDMDKGWGCSEGLRNDFDNQTMVWMWEKEG